MIGRDVLPELERRAEDRYERSARDGTILVLIITVLLVIRLWQP